VFAKGRERGGMRGCEEKLEIEIKKRQDSRVRNCAELEEEKTENWLCKEGGRPG